MQNSFKTSDINTGFGGFCGLVDLQTTISGCEMTLETMVEISNLVKRLDERLAQLNPELPRISTANDGQSISGSFASMLSAYQEAFNAMAAAARSAALLGLGAPGQQPVVLNLQTNPNVQVSAPQPAPQVEVAAPAAAEAPAPQPAAEQQQVAQAAPPPAAAQPKAAPAPKVPAPAGDLKPVGAVASQRFSTNAPSGKKIRDAAEVTKPLKPIEMPNAEHQVGPMLTHGMGIVYAHGAELRKHWPGARDAKAALDKAIPNESWRLLDFDGTLFCLAEDRGMVFSANDLHKEGTFQGRYIAQTHTVSAWAGLQDNDGVLSLVLRDKSGRTIGEAVAVGNPFGAQVFIVSSDEAVYIAFATGELFRVEGGVLQALPKADKHGRIIALAVDERGLIVTNQGANGVVISLHDQNGTVIVESSVVAGGASHAPALLNGNAYLFDDAKSELVVIDLDTLTTSSCKSIEGVTGVGRLIALQEDSGVTVALMSADKDGRPHDVYLHEVESGANTKICHLSATKGDIAYADGHIVVTSTSTIQNMTQVFRIYSPRAAVKEA